MTVTPGWTCAVLWLAVWLPAGATRTTAPAQDHPGTYAEADIAYGARLYAVHCTMCHGPNGDLVGNVDLRSGRFRNAGTDQQLTSLIRSGIPGTGMPAFKLDTPELAGIVSYLRNMRTFDARAVP